MAALLQRVALLALFGLCACRTYGDKLASTRHAVAQGEPQAALAQVDELLDLDSPSQLPERWGKEVPLLVLERATLLQAVADYSSSRSNFQAAEEELEMLDLSKDVPGRLSEYLLNGSAKAYRTTPIEKLFINSLNLLNYLLLGDLQGARVEARRWRVMRDFLRDHDGGSALALGSAYGAFLAGYSFERSNRPDQALRYYSEAMAHARLPFLEPYIAELSASSAFRSPQVQEAIAASAGRALNKEHADVLLVAQVGRVPYREARRVPVGLALGLAANYFTGDTSVLERGLFKFVNYPELMVEEYGPRGVELKVDGQPTQMELLANADLAVQEEYKKMRPKIVAAALTRAITRAVAAEGSRAGGKAAAKGEGSSESGELLGGLLSMAVEGSLVLADKPDTRSWSVLPGYYFVTRIRVAPGEHKLQIRLDPTRSVYEQRFSAKAGQAQVLLISAYQ